MCVSAKLLANWVIMGRGLDSLGPGRNRKALILLSLCVAVCWAACVPAMSKPVRMTGTAYVIDGDTVVIGRRHIRLFGIDAFERDQTCGRFQCGAEAAKGLRDLTHGQRLTCTQKDIDSYGRMVAICKLSSGLDIGGELVRRGLAVDYRRFTSDYLDEEADAEAHKRGAWAYGFHSPLEYRRSHSH